MKLSRLIFALLFSLSTIQVSAYHFMGGHITYTCDAQNAYSFTIEIYRDCGTTMMPTTFDLNINSVSCNISTTVTLELLVNPPQIISPLCSSQPNPCTNPSVGITGIERYIYSHVANSVISDPPVVLVACSDWVFSINSCCRTNQITTGSNNSSFKILTTLNNIVAPCNNSPWFDFETPFYACLGDTSVYSLGTIEDDGDSLSFKMVDCLDINGVVNYNNGFSGQNPISNNYIEFDSLTGELRFVPTVLQMSIICILVEEYRNGVKIGEVLREGRIEILNCANQLPTLSGINGTYRQDSISVCAGQNLCFTLDAFDADTTNSIALSFAYNLSGASITTTQTANNAKQITVCWTPTLNDLGLNYFGVSVRDDACPILGINNYGYVIKVLGSLGGSAFLSQMTINEGSSAPLLINLLDTNCTVSWSADSTLSCTNCLNPIATPTTTTTYYYQINCLNANCGSVITDSIVVNVIPLRTINGTISRHDGSPLSNSTVTIYKSTGTIIGSTPTNANGNYTITTFENAIYLRALPSNLHLDQQLTYYDSVTNIANAALVSLTTTQQTIDFSTLFLPPPFTISGLVTQSDASPFSNSTIDLLNQNGVNIATTQTNAQGIYNFIISDTTLQYYIKAKPSTNSNQLTTYFQDSLTIQTANLISIDSTNTIANFSTNEKMSISGAKFMSGKVRENGINGMPIPNFRLILKDNNGNVINEHFTENSGFFVFGGLPNGVYSIWADKLGINNNLAPLIELKANEASPNNLVLIVHTDSLELLYTTSTSEQRIVQKFAIFPNPIQTTFTVQYDLLAAANVNIDILDVSGRVVKNVKNERQNAGNYQILEEISKNNFADGIYFIRLNFDNQIITKRVVIKGQ